MVFSSPIFLFVFLPVTYLGYRILPGLPLRNAWLTLASLVFFSFGQLPYLVLLLISVLINYLFGLWLQSGERHRRLAAGLAAALCVRLNCTPAQVPVENLRALLKENGAVLTIPQEVASHENVEKSAI